MNRINPKTLSILARAAALLFVVTAGVALATSGDAWAFKAHPLVTPTEPPIVLIPGPTCPTQTVTSASNTIFEVTGPLSTASGDCIDLMGSNDGLLTNGNTITCTGTCATGVNVMGSQDMVEGAGSKVSGFATGLLNNGSQNVGDEWQLDDNQIGLHLKGSQNNFVSLVACGNAAVTDGVTNSGTGIWIDGGANNYVTNFLAGGGTGSDCAGNGADGVLITGANTSGISIFGAVGNGGNGVHLGGLTNGGNHQVKVADSGPDSGAVSDNMANGIFLDAREKSANDQVTLTEASGNHDFDAQDATAGCGSGSTFNFWFGNFFTNTEDGSTTPSGCIH